MKLPVFDTSLANCSTCELDAQCKAGKLCFAYQPPKNFNGLMLIGEGPGQHEVLQGRPFCLVPETPVLMADLSWKPLGDVVIGDQILSVSENPRGGHPGASGSYGRMWEVATVTRTVHHRTSTHRVVTNHGELRGSGDHLVLTNPKHEWRRLDTLAAGQRRATHIVSIGGPWTEATSKDAGWLAGFLDGEGHVTGSRNVDTHGRGVVGWSQNAGPIDARAVAITNALGFQLRVHEESRTNGVVCMRQHVRGGQLASLRLLGIVRPQRLIADLLRVIPHLTTRSLLRAKTLLREPAGVTDVVDITTTSGTFIANGFIVHNCGQSGKLLRALIESAGLNMDECWITNATLGRPPVMKDKKGFHEQYPNAISSCLSRLEAEIAACKPRVIVTLGAAALIAMTGRDKVGVRREAFDCKACSNTRKAGPVLQCSAPVQQGDGTAKPCHELHFIEGTTMEAQAASVEALKLHGCKACGARFKNVRAKMVKCPACGGRKMRDTEIHSFVHDYGLTQVAGAIFEPAPGAEERRAHEIDHWFHEQGVRYLVPTYHPAFLLRDQQFMAKAVQKHLGKAKRLLTEDAPWPVEYEVTRDPEVLRAYVTGGWWPNPTPVFTVDIETDAIRETSEGPVRGDARDPYQVTEIKVVGIHRQGTDHGLVVDTRGVQIMSGDDDLLNALQDFLENPGIPKCYHNGLYDMPCFVHLWGFDWEKLNTGYADDTLGAHAALYPDEPHDLGHVTFSFTDSRAWKPERRVKGEAVHEDFNELALYNARDIWNTNAVRESMGAANGKAVPGGKLHRAGLSKVYEVDSQLRKVAFEMQMVGMPVNRDAREEAAKKARSLRDAALGRCRKAAEVAQFQGEFNPFSPKDLQKVLFGTQEGFGLPVLKATKTGASSDEGTVYKLLGIAKDEPVIQFLRALLDVREHHKVLSTYVESDKLAPRADGRIHANWKPWGARTGRFSSSPNMQNVPIWLRHIFEAPPGRVLVGADGDQIELRGIGALSGDAELIRRCMTADEKRKLEPDYDPHSFVAAIAFGSQYTGLLLVDTTHDKKLAEVGECKCQTCRRKALRDLEKRVIYGGNYGAGAKKIHEVILQSLGVDYKGPPITVEMVAHVQKTIDKVFPGISKWRERAYAEAHQKREIRSPLHGRRRIFPLGDIPFTEIANYPIQSLAGDIMNDATVNIYYELASVDPTAYFVAQIHDALYIEAAEDKGEAVGKLLEKHMTCEHVLQPGAPAMRFTASAKVGRKMAG